MPLNQPGEIMKCLKRPVTAGGFIEVGIERTSNFIWIKRANPGTSGAAWRKGVQICTPEIPELLGTLVIGLGCGAMAKLFSQPAGAPILVTILQVARDTSYFHVRRDIAQIAIIRQVPAIAPGIRRLNLVIFAHIAQRLLVVDSNKAFESGFAKQYIAVNCRTPECQEGYSSSIPRSLGMQSRRVNRV